MFVYPSGDHLVDKPVCPLYSSFEDSIGKIASDTGRNVGPHSPETWCWGVVCASGTDVDDCHTE